MKHFFSILILQLIVTVGIGQTGVKPTAHQEKLDQFMWSFSKNKSIPAKKSAIDFDVMDNWRGLGSYLAVSEDGRYFAYTINKMAYNDFAFGLFKVDSLIIQSSKNKTRKVFTGVETGSFTEDSKQYIFHDKGTLCFLQLEGMQLKQVTNIASYKTSQNKSLAYQKKGSDSLIIKNLTTGKEKTIPGITGYEFSSRGDWLMCRDNVKGLLLYNVTTGAEHRFPAVDIYSFAENGKALLITSVVECSTTLRYLSLPQVEAKTIWTGSEKTSISNFQFDDSGTQLIFTVVDSANSSKSGIGYYQSGMEKVVLKSTSQMPGIPVELEIASVSFTNNGRYLQLLLQPRPVAGEKANMDIAGLEVWNHKDLNLQSAQSTQLNEKESFNAIVNIENGRIVFMEGNDKKISQLHGDFALVKKDPTTGDRFWETAKKDSLWIVSLRDGNSKFLNIQSNRYWFSPASNYLVFFDNSNGCHYYSYDMNSALVKNIAANVPENQLGITDHENDQNRKSGNLAAWVENEPGVLVYDDYDIWKLDLTGKQPALNITNGMGRANNTVLSLFTTDRNSSEIPTLNANESLLLRGYNSITKQIGFYKKNGIRKGTPAQLYMGNYLKTKLF